MPEEPQTSRGFARKANMARRPTVQQLTMDESATVPDGNNHQYEDPKTPVTPKSPRSPRSPFRFPSKKPQQEDENHNPQMQGADPQSRVNLPSSQTTSSLSNLQRAPTPAADEKNERTQPVRSGFFGNYKASRSSNRLQSDSARPANEESISQDAERPVTTRKVSAQEPIRTGTTLHVSLPHFFYHSLTLYSI